MAGRAFSFCSVFASSVVSLQVQSALCFKPLRPEIRSQMVLVWKKYRLLSKAEQIFLDRLKEKLQR
jgi:DNA-binding transcriptional LysR family regulator